MTQATTAQQGTAAPRPATAVVRLTIHGEPASKANSRKLVTFGGIPRVIKSDKALAYLRAVERQVPVRRRLLTGGLVLHCRVHYASRRPDLDVSLILDALQGRIYENDRQVREQHLYWALDPENPRAELVIEALEPQQGGLDL